MTEARLFFVTDSVLDNEELFETLSEAQDHSSHLETGTGRRIRICIVRNAYLDHGNWTYEDELDTFETVKVLEQELSQEKGDM